MQRLFAMIWLTVKAAVRYRLIWALSAILLAGVVALPLIVKDDGTARGFTQILLTYTLALTTSILGFATLWLACGTLARDVEECQIQVVATKPIHRWEIWLGKFLGIMVLNATLLSASGVCVYFLLQWRARQLPEKQQVILREEIFVARGSAREPIPDYKADAARVLRERLEKNPVPVADMQQVEAIVTAQVKAAYEQVPPGYRREWKIKLDGGDRLADKPLYLRVKFNAAQSSESGTFMGLWEIGDPASNRVHREAMSLAADTFHEFRVPPNLLDKDGMLLVNFINRNETALLFPLEDGMEVLYHEGGFTVNFIRGLLIILFWLGFLGSIGLAASSFLSLPVAAFVSLGVLIVGFSSGTMSQIIEQGTVGAVNHETGVADNPMLLDHIALPVFRAMLKLVNLVQGFSPIDSLSTGRSIGWGQIGLAFFQICLVLGGLVCLAGIVIFNRRELATAQGTS